MQALTWTVEILYRILGDRALMPPPSAENSANRFSLRALEVIAVGIARNRDLIMSQTNPDFFLKDKIESFWQQPQVTEMSASGLRGTVRLQRTIPFGAHWFNPNA